MSEHPVYLFFGMMSAVSHGFIRSQDPLLCTVKLLEEEEKKALFSLLLCDIEEGRVPAPPSKILELGLVHLAGGTYSMDRGVRDVLLASCTRGARDRLLVRTERVEKPQENKEYSEMLFRTVSNTLNGNREMKKLMKNRGIIEEEGITHKGFNFLLSGKKQQMWEIIISHLETEKDALEMELLALCEILLKDHKRVYLIDRSEHRAKILGLLELLGVVRIERGEVRFSSLFSILFDDEMGQEKALVLESNFRMYIYGNNQLSHYIISLFSNKIREFPNLVVASLNEESFRKALEIGITSKQIVAYLSTNSMYKIDRNVLEQMEVWETRRKRISTWRSYLLSNFLNHRDYQLVEEFCAKNNIEHRAYREQRIIVVDLERYEEVKHFVKSNIR